MRLGPSDLAIGAGGLLLGIVFLTMGVRAPAASQEQAEKIAATTATATVDDVVAERDWAALKMTLPSGEHTVVSLGRGQPYRDTMEVYLDGYGNWQLGSPPDDSGFARALASVLAVMGVAALAGSAGLVLHTAYIRPERVS